jgi:hypothetical protein
MVVRKRKKIEIEKVWRKRGGEGDRGVFDARKRLMEVWMKNLARGRIKGQGLIENVA